MFRTALIGIAMALTSLHAQASQFANIEIYDRHSGQTLPVYTHEGRLYVTGEPKHEYEVRIRSRSGQRILAVTSVDGVNVISGQTATPGQTGYVLDGYGSVDIAGWRKSTDQIATFYFTSLPDSYAARTGRKDDVGVIGVALFREKQKTRCCWPWASARENDAATGRSAPSSAPADALADERSAGARPEHEAKKSRQESRLGTGHGRPEDSSIVYTDFTRASDRPDEVISIYYDSYRNLVAQGVIPVYSRNDRHPNPFPGGFVPDPR